MTHSRSSDGDGVRDNGPEPDDDALDDADIECLRSMQETGKSGLTGEELARAEEKIRDAWKRHADNLSTEE